MHAKHWPVRKSFEVTVRLKGRTFLVRRRAVLSVRFQEATVGELLDFDATHAGEWAFRFVVERCRKLREWESAALWDARWRVFDMLRDPYFGKDDKTQERPKEWSPFSATLVWLSEHLACPPHVLLATYTPPQFKALAEGLAWNVNAQSKEGQAANKAIANRANMDSVTEEETRRRLADLEERLKNRKR